jgi:hypothetical protein
MHSLAARNQCAKWTGLPVNVEPLAPAQAGANDRLLDQYLLTCPSCVKPAAAHVAPALDPVSGPTLVRFVCPDSCAVDDAAVLAQLAEARLDLSA